MLVLPQFFSVKWHPNNKNHYIERGYNFTNFKDEFEVSISDLPNSSKISVNVICDLCGKKYNKTLSNITRDRKLNKGDICAQCSPKQAKITCLTKYGVEHTSQLESVKQKLFATNLEKYGHTCSLQNENIKEKAKQTLLDKYGVMNCMQSEEVREKAKNTNIEKYGTPYLMQNEDIKTLAHQRMEELYGVKHALQHDEFKQKAIATTIENYGVPYCTQSPEVMTKINNTMYQNDTAPGSIQQRYLCHLLNGKFNYPVESVRLDITLLDEKVDIEYDGGAHDYSVKLGALTKQEAENIDMKRYYFLKSRGWKEIRIISTKDLLPADDVILQFIQDAKDYLNTGHSWYKIDIDNSLIECSQYIKFINLGLLRKIKKENIGE